MWNLERRKISTFFFVQVENASSLLEEASNISREDPYSKMARTKLIEGSRWILQGTSSVLLCFDESEVGEYNNIDLRIRISFFIWIRGSGSVFYKMDPWIRIFKTLVPR